MEPRLIAITGPLKGTTFALTEGETSVGREPSNAVCLNDPSVSRRHCVFTREGERFKVADLDSFNGTFVNGVPVKEQWLDHGDQVGVGDVLLILALREAEEATPVTLDEGNVSTRSTVRLRRENALYLSPEKVLAALPPAARVARDLNALLRVSAVVNTARGVEALQRQLLELLLEVVPAERGAILLTGAGTAEHLSAFGWSRPAGRSQAVSVSRTVVSQVLGEGVSILSNDVLGHDAMGKAESLLASRVSSLLCVPLTTVERSLGVIYLDTSDPVARFDEGHLELLTAIASVAAIALEKAQRVEALEGENDRLREELGVGHRMIGESPRLAEVYRFISKVASADSTVLIRGESGTGKELAARAIHAGGARARKPFVAVNCATLSESLLESELFGHERGAFTGAVAQKRGKLEVADGGTVFLDEVGELAANIQAKLLRVLQEREFERVGGTRPIRVDVRVVAATNRDLEEAVRAGGFRQDLYYRLNVLPLVMPPLRERREDVPLLASYFAAKYSRKVGRRVVGVSPEARALLTNYDWPGNVRELENTIERAVVLGTTEVILPEDLPEALLETAAAGGGTGAESFYDAVKEAKKELITVALRKAQGNYTEAARLLGVHPNNLHRLIRNLNLKASL